MLISGPLLPSTEPKQRTFSTLPTARVDAHARGSASAPCEADEVAVGSHAWARPWQTGDCGVAASLRHQHDIEPEAPHGVGLLTNCVMSVVYLRSARPCPPYLPITYASRSRDWCGGSHCGTTTVMNSRVQESWPAGIYGRWCVAGACMTQRKEGRRRTQR